jgi:phosphate-selective porin
MKKKNSRFTIMHGRFIFSILILAIGTGLLTGCSTGASEAPEEPHVYNSGDTTAPVIQINTPTAGQVFVNGNSISITGRITDDGGLYRGDIRITNDANNAVIKEQHYEIHGFRSYDYSLSHTVSVGAASDYTITVAFEDHGLNVTTKTVKVKANP